MDTCGKAYQTEKRVEITAREAQDHAERTAQEHQASDHGEETKHQTRYRRAAAAGEEFLFRE